MFISLEGIEGSGKTTQIAQLASFLEENGHTVVVTREPGGTQIGYEIRKVLLASSHAEMASQTELLLFMADRAQHLHEVVLPALKEKKTVVCDRYYDATVAYQAASRGISHEIITHLHETLFDNLLPDITFLLDVDPKIGLKRAWDRIEETNNGHEARFEKEREAFHEKVRAGYLALAERYPNRFVIIDAEMSPEEITKKIQTELTRILKLT